MKRYKCYKNHTNNDVPPLTVGKTYTLIERYENGGRVDGEFIIKGFLNNWGGKTIATLEEIDMFFKPLFTYGK